MDLTLTAAQRRKARRTAFLLGALAFCMYLGFILVTGYWQ